MRRLLRRARLSWQWRSLGVRDNGIVGYLRHVRRFEALRHRIVRTLEP